MESALWYIRSPDDFPRRFSWSSVHIEHSRFFRGILPSVLSRLYGILLGRTKDITECFFCSVPNASDNFRQELLFCNVRIILSPFCNHKYQSYFRVSAGSTAFILRVYVTL